VDTVSLDDSNSWSYTMDHAKWGVSTNAHGKAVGCIGDINRMSSQEGRGGGTVCTNDDRIYYGFKYAISEVEACNSQERLML